MQFRRSNPTYKEIATEVKGRGFKKAFVCSDPDLIKFCVTKKVTDVLDNADIDYEIYSEIKPNPTIENVQTGVAAFKASGADCIIAIGGGSSMDTAKAIGIIIKNPDFAERLDFCRVVMGFVLKLNEPLLCFAVNSYRNFD